MEKNYISSTFVFGVLVTCLGLCSCDTTTQLIVGTKRPPTDPKSIKVLFEEPKRYEKIAILDADSVNTLKWTQQGALDATIERIKSKAAKLGANAVLMMDIDSVASGVSHGPTFVSGNVTNYGATSSVSMTAYPTTFTSPLRVNTAKAIAIYVP
jgi:uncharacterized protein YbjQ (UPF0145 family)